jgi:hypothetical protein
VQKQQKIFEYVTQSSNQKKAGFLKKASTPPSHFPMNLRRTIIEKHEKAYRVSLKVSVDVEVGLEAEGEVLPLASDEGLGSCSGMDCTMHFQA